MENEKKKFIDRMQKSFAEGNYWYIPEGGSFKSLNAALDAIEEYEKRVPIEYDIDVINTIKEARALGIKSNLNSAESLEEQKQMLASLKTEIARVKQEQTVEYEIIN